MCSIPGWGRSPGGGHGNPLNSLAWGIPWTEEPGGQQSLGLQRVRHNCSDLARILPFKVSYGEFAFMDWVGLLVISVKFAC